MVVGLAVVVAVVVIVGALLAITVFGRSGGVLRRLVLATRIPIADAGEGERVKIQGRIDRPTAAPIETIIGGHSAVCSRINLTYHHQGSRFVEADRFDSFVVRDDSGEATVLTEQATIQFGDRSAAGRLDGASIDGWARTILERDGLRFTGTPAGHVDVEEHYLAPGDEVAVLGVARWESVAGPAGGPQRRVVIGVDPEIGVVISAHRSTFDD